jgi:hypothetical protein
MKDEECHEENRWKKIKRKDYVRIENRRLFIH